MADAFGFVVCHHQRRAEAWEIAESELQLRHHERASEAAAEIHLVTLKHIQALFRVPSLAGMVAAMNAAYGKMAEMRTGLNTIAKMVGGTDGGSVRVVVNDVRRTVETVSSQAPSTPAR